MAEYRLTPDKICSYDEAYDIYDAEEIGWCAKCNCDKNCPMYKKLHKHFKRKRCEL